LCALTALRRFYTFSITDADLIGVELKSEIELKIGNP